jgi:hypothetical protein
MCARKETDVRESPNDSTFGDRERQDENPVSSLPERNNTLYCTRTALSIVLKNVDFLRFFK